MATAKAAVVVLYNHPKDAAAFEQYYNGTHVPLVGEHADTLGVRRVELTKLASPDGGTPAFYRKAELWFDSEQAMKTAMATPEFGVVAGDLSKFATGGVVVLTSVETNV